MTTSASGDLFADELTLAAQEVLGLLSGVAAFALLGLEVKLDEGGAEALHLCARRGAHVVGADIGTEPSGGRDGLEPGNTGTEHQHLGGRHRAGRCHVEGEELRELLGCQQHCPVARDQRLGREHVHRLRPGDPGQKVQAERRDPALPKRTDEVEVRRGLEVAHDAGALAHKADLLQAQRLHLADEARRAKQRRGVHQGDTC